MTAFLKNHPFPVEAFFECSLVFTFAAPSDDLRALVPGCFRLDTFGAWAFVAVAVVKTRALRPKGFPRWLGNDFTLAGYRIFVRHTTAAGRELRGLYILKSETDRRKMEMLGRMFTRYDYKTTDLALTQTGTRTSITSIRSGLDAEVDSGPEAADLPAGSPFADWKQARRFAGPLPFTFSFDAEARSILTVEGVRTGWRPRPVQSVRCESAFIRSLPLREVRLASAFEVRNVPYAWKKGEVERWNG